MKKFTSLHWMLIVAVLAVVATTLAACGDDDNNGISRDGDRTFKMTMLNHVTDLQTGEVMPLNEAVTNYTYNMNNNTVAMTMRAALDGSTVQEFPISTMSMSEVGSSAVYAFKSANPSSIVSDLDGIIDFAEISTRNYYTVNGRYRVFSTKPEIFFLNTSTAIVPNDTTASTTYSGAMYQFNIDPATMTADFLMLGLLFEPVSKFFNSVRMPGATVEATSTGYTITGGPNVRTDSYYSRNLDKTDNYTTHDSIQNLKATIDLEKNTVEADLYFNIKHHVTIKGTVY